VDQPSDEARWTTMLELALDGDASAYQSLLQRLAAALRGALGSRARRAGLDNEDVVQEVLLALHMKRSTWVRGTPVAPWVAAIARNKIVDAYRRRGARPEVSLENILETLQADDDSNTLDEAHDLERLLTRLPPKQRLIVSEISLQGYTALETARRLNMSEVAVRVTLHRSLKRLSAALRGAHEN
jgi:RNA polymerase sigma-70 factor, ECF subfamily